MTGVVDFLSDSGVLKWEMVIGTVEFCTHTSMLNYSNISLKLGKFKLNVLQKLILYLLCTCTSVVGVLKFINYASAHKQLLCEYVHLYMCVHVCMCTCFIDFQIAGEIKH